jgi:hypothetical protein
MELTYDMFYKLFSAYFHKIFTIAYENNLYENIQLYFNLLFLSKLFIHKHLYDKH